jgi:nucleoside phosphorylase
MISTTQRKLLSLVASGTRALHSIFEDDSEIANLQDLNVRAIRFEEKLTADTAENGFSGEDAADLVHFMIREFATLVDGPKRKPLMYPLAADKLHKWPALAPSFGKNYFKRALGECENVKLDASGPLDCLLVTAFETEFLAVVRRLDYFFEATSRSTRGFQLGPHEQSQRAGWVTGAVRRRGQIAKVGVVCCARYGPAAASAAVATLLPVYRPRYVFVVGVGASLADEDDFALGDLGFSLCVDDITLGKEETDTEIFTKIPFNGRILSLDRLSPEVRAELDGNFWLEGGEVVLRGVLRRSTKELLLARLQSIRERRAVELLFEASRGRADKLNLERNLKLRPTSKILVDAAGKVAKRGKWRKRIRLDPPVPAVRSPRAQEVGVLSGSSVVKQYGMREYLQLKFPGRVLLEMEGAGVGEACEAAKAELPIVIKSACDWATPAKEKSWQPYCADVAAAFAIEVAVELASQLNQKKEVTNALP